MTNCILENCTGLEDPGTNRMLLKGMSGERVEKILRYRKENDRKRSAMAGVLLRDVLPRFGISQDEIRVSEKGRLYTEKSMDFNLSHSGDYVLLAVSDRQVGCDVEKIRDVKDHLTDYCCSPEEKKWCDSHSPEQQLTAFFRLWTAKESYIKMTGEGLSLPFHKYSVFPKITSGNDLERLKAELKWRTPVDCEYLGSMQVFREGKKEKCRIHQMMTGDGYVISVCISNKSRQAV
jgi:4'-phosphopantetheinyl transferase